MFRSVSAFMISPTMTANPFSSRASSSRRTAHCIPVSTMRRRRHSDAGSGKSRRAAAPGLACGATTRHEAGAGIRSAPSTASKRGETMRRGDRPAMVPLSMVTDGSPSSFFVMRTSARRPVRPAGQRLSPGFQDNAAPVLLDDRDDRPQPLRPVRKMAVPQICQPRRRAAGGSRCNAVLAQRRAMHRRPTGGTGRQADLKHDRQTGIVQPGHVDDRCRCPTAARSSCLRIGPRHTGVVNAMERLHRPRAVLPAPI